MATKVILEGDYFGIKEVKNGYLVGLSQPEDMELIKIMAWNSKNGDKNEVLDKLTGVKKGSGLKVECYVSSYNNEVKFTAKKVM